MIKIILLLSFLVSSNSNFNTCNTPSNKEEISWKEGRKLKWEYFKGVIPANDPASAKSAIAISYTCKATEKIKKVKTFCFFLQDKSWVKDKTEWGLSHEQVHFDIGEVSRRLLQYKCDSVINSQGYITPFLADKLFKEAEAYHQLLQRSYDRETEHSVKPLIQSLWNEKVDSLLKISALKD